LDVFGCRCGSFRFRIYGEFEESGRKKEATAAKFGEPQNGRELSSGGSPAFGCSFLLSESASDSQESTYNELDEEVKVDESEEPTQTPSFLSAPAHSPDNEFSEPAEDSPGSVSTPGDPHEIGCSWGSTPPTPPHTDVVDARDDESEDYMQEYGTFSVLATFEETEFSDPLFRFSPS
jgi:hypothetical protein